MLGSDAVLHMSRSKLIEVGSCEVRRLSLALSPLHYAFIIPDDRVLTESPWGRIGKFRSRFTL